MVLSSIFYVLAILVVAYNAHLLPFVWHVRVLLPIIKLFRQKKNASVLIKTVRGQDPHKIKILVPRYQVWPSNVDYNMHKSNSTYASDMDVARLTAAAELFGPFLVPMDFYLSLEQHIVSYMYAVGRFVTRPSEKQASKDVLPLNKSVVRKRKDRSVLHTILVSIFCFKLGRLTILPAVVLSICGYGSSSNQARCLRLHLQGSQSIIGYLAGGWKDDTDAVKSVKSYGAMLKQLGNEGDVMQKALESFGVGDQD